MSITDLENTILFVNDAFLRIYGYERHELLGRSIEMVRSPDAPQPSAAEILSATLAGGWQGELVNRRKDGSELPISLSTSVVRDEAGRPLALIRVATDITERRRAERALRESERRLRALYDDTPAMDFALAPDGTVLSVNRFGASHLGYAAGELVGRSVLTVVHPKDRAAVKRQLAACRGGLGRVVTLEFRTLRKDDSVLWVREDALAVRDPSGDTVLRVVSTDITEQKRSQQLHRNLLDVIPRSVLLIDQQRRVVFANRDFLEKNRRSEAETVGRTIHEIFPMTIMNETRMDDRIHDVFQTHQPVMAETMACQLPGVPLRVYNYAVVPVVWDGGVDSVMLLMDDVTEQIRLGEEARQTQRQLTSIVESASELVVSTDSEGRIVTMNPAFGRVSGFSVGEVIGRLLPEFCSEEHRVLVSENLRRVEESGKPSEVQWDLRTRSGQTVPVSWVCSPMRDNTGKAMGVVAVGRDLTERRKFEAQLLQSEKLAALGVMAGGIAHELRNPLAISSSAAQLILESPGDAKKVRVCAEKIHSGITRAAVIIEGMLRFARSSASTPRQSVGLGALVREMLALLADQAQLQKVAVKSCISRSPLVVCGDANLLQQLLMNLILNAFNAMPDGGTLRVSLSRQDDLAVLAVTDTGRGIPPEDHGRLFDPFYTTMPVGKGTGLGLSLCYSIVKQHLGTIEVASTVGQGSTFTVRLPLEKREGKP